jgi:hypothetical protein
MEMTLTTPALVFPAITLLLLAYTNRFLATATLVRSLHANYLLHKTPNLAGQIHNLRIRLILIKYTQVFGIGSLLLSVVSIFLLFASLEHLGVIAFVGSLLTMQVSLLISLYETYISIDALKLQLSDMEDKI